MPNISVLPYEGPFDSRKLAKGLVEIGFSIPDAEETAEFVVCQLGNGFGMSVNSHDQAEKLVKALRASGLKVKWAHD